MCLVSVDDTVVRTPAPASSSMVRSTDKNTIIHVIMIIRDKNFNKKSWEAVEATARNSASGKIMQNTCPVVAYYEAAHSLHMTLKAEQTQNSADIDKLIN